ncbi:aspartate--tRNA ligase [Neolewinella lacunae]|uniref:Aspartate--tRNA ligase n=1 Tax=Neolewinella lacunae TaxID=1517758 RepID=A0A923TC28_9BACT|nr:aspartate--tRNA ligase [Neolewinella lacunae]MBC6993267.1 aspartate--tRNA ligase [Neolewinella lacunae]MDN3635686.1 aspartate--tRNA ligase [Neolewinella lacunae]
MFRTHNCGELRLTDAGKDVTLSGWVQIGRDFGGLTFVDLRDRYGITQVVFDGDDNAALSERARKLGREWVIQVKGRVRERSNKNPNRATGDIEIIAHELTILNSSKVPPFTIEEDSDGGDELRMQYRFLDLRRPPLQQNIIFRSRLALAVRAYLGGQQFVEVETPFLIKSTPEGARDFVVPSRLNEGQFYALPQSPQTFKQLLMVAGYDRYFQIVKCFRDEDLRADRQPEFTQIDCEMAFVTQDEVLDTFEGLTRHLFQVMKGVDLGKFPRMFYDDAMRRYGSDKPDLRFGMELVDLNAVAQGKGFPVFDAAELVVGICVPGQSELTRKQLDGLTDWVKRPQIGAKGLVYVKCNADGTFKSSVDKFFDHAALAAWAEACGAKAGDLLLVISGEDEKSRKQLGSLRLHVAAELGMIPENTFAPLWVVDFPLLEWDEDSQRFHAMHHPFTSPKREEVERMLTGDHETMKSLKADAYDLVINGAEIGGGSVRIYDRTLQERNFKLLGFTKEQAEEQFGFLMGAFEYGAPPHAGIAFGFDRLCAVMNGQSSIRDFIAFPKNNQGRDMMIDAPAAIDDAQLKELNLRVTV